MVIGIDAGALTPDKESVKVGVYRVTSELILALTTLYPEHTYRLYSFRPIEKKLLQSFSRNTKNFVLSPSHGYMKVRLPLELLIHPVDVFLGMSQSIPFLRRTKSIGWVYDIAFHHKPEWYPGLAHILEHQTKLMVKRASHIITISHYVKDDIVREYGVPVHTVHVCHLGTSKLFTEKGKKYIHDSPYILSVGSLKRAKQLPYLIESVSRLNSKLKMKYDLLLVGSHNWLDPDIQSCIQSFHAESFVKTIGYVDDETVALLYRGASLFAATGLREGFCLPVVEAMACGCSVVAIDSGALREIVGTDGTLVKPGSPELFSQALYTSLKMKKRKVINRYSWDQCARDVMTVIEAV